VEKPQNLLNSLGRIVGKSHPQYADYATSQFISVKSEGATGDGYTDDTAAIQQVIDKVCCIPFISCDCINALSKYAGCKIIFFDAGTYYVTDTITIPAGTQIVGEAWSVIMAGGSAFSDQNNPRVVIKAGGDSSDGILEISDMLFTTAGPGNEAVCSLLLATLIYHSSWCNNDRVECSRSCRSTGCCGNVGQPY